MPGGAFEVLDRHGVTYSALARNHDLIDSSTDDQRRLVVYSAQHDGLDPF